MESVNDGKHDEVKNKDVDSDATIPPGFETFFNVDKHGSRSLRTGKCSTSFRNYKRKDVKYYSFIDEIKWMIEVGGALGYNIKGSIRSLRRMINGIAPVLEVENFTNWKKRFMCHIIGIEPQFENIILNGPFIHKAAGQKKPEGQWIEDERKAANLDQRLKSLIISVLPDDQMNYVINCLIEKSTWDDLIQYHDRLSNVKESRAIDLKLCYNTFKLKEGEFLTQTFTIYKALMNELVNDGIKLLNLEINTGFINGLPKKWLSLCQSLRNTKHVKDSELASLFDSRDDEEDTRSSNEYLNDLEEEYQARALLAKSKRPKDLVFIKSLAYNPEVSITGSNKPKLSEAEDSTLSNHDTGKVPSNESQRNTTYHLVVVSDFSATDYDLADEYLVCSTPLPSPEKLNGAEHVFGPKTIKSILKSKPHSKLKL
nr:retrovirus-related Pol polyprotein from transposon TNT 1-94 [Tanacetum cinerariifolium]